MSSFADVFKNLALQTGFATLTWKHYVMILIACVFMYLAIVKGFEPLLLVPISFGMFLVNMFPDIIADGGLLHYFYLLDEWSILPSLIFMGVGAMTDFGPLIANPKSFLLGAAAQFGIYAAYFLAFLMGFNGKEAAAISIIGGADGPTSIFLAGKLGPDGVNRMIRDIRIAERWLGKEELYIDSSVASAKVKLERSIATNKTLHPGDIITEDDIHLLSPGDGFKWAEREKVVGHKVLKEIPRNEIIYPSSII